VARSLGWLRRSTTPENPPSTMPEAQEAIIKSRVERELVSELRPRVDRAVSDLAQERETNHMAARFRSALRGGAA
jgi:hypothetical protein